MHIYIKLFLQGVNAQFIEKDKIVLRTLAVAELFERHTGQYLKDTIIAILQKYNISTEQIYTCTTDNGRNMLKCISLINEDENDAENFDDNNTEFDQTLEHFSLDTKCIGKLIEPSTIIYHMPQIKPTFTNRFNTP